MASLRPFLLLLAVSFLLTSRNAECFFLGRLPSFGFNFSVQVSQDGAANNTLAGLISSSQSNAAEAESRASDLVSEIERLFSLTFGNFEANITGEINLSANQSQTLLDQALELGGAIADCAQERYDEYETLLNDTLNDLESCITNKVQQGMDIARDLMEDHARAHWIAGNATVGLRNCTRLSGGNPILLISPQVLACKLRLAAELGRQSAVFGAEMARDLTAAGVYLGTLKIDLASCGFLATTRAIEGKAIIASEIAACVADQ